DEVRLWNVALSAPQLLAGKGSCLGGLEPGLMGYWRLEEGAGTIANDSTENLDQGLIINALWVTPGSPISCPFVPPPPVPIVGGLRNVPIPLPANLADFVSNRTNAIRLGK